MAYIGPLLGHTTRKTPTSKEAFTILHSEIHNYVLENYNLHKDPK